LRSKTRVFRFGEIIVTLKFSLRGKIISFVPEADKYMQLQIPRLEYEIRSGSIFGEPTAARKFSE